MSHFENRGTAGKLIAATALAEAGTGREPEPAHGQPHDGERGAS